MTDYRQCSATDKPPAYEVEFTDADGVTQALVTVLGSDLEVSVAASSDFIATAVGRLTTSRRRRILCTDLCTEFF